jgi:hypothetical protein
MMVKRKRAPGGGRKRLGASVAQNLTIRVDDDLRAQLEAAAIAREKRNWNLSQEILLRLRTSLSNEREQQRDRPMRALCFLIAQLANHVVGPKIVREGKEVALYDWRADPFFYKAFKIAVGQLLDAIDPPGPIKPHEITVENEADLDPSTRRYLESFKTPEARAQYAADHILAALRALPQWPQWPAEAREELRKLVTESGLPQLVREFYGIPDAALALAVKPRPFTRQREGETVKITAKLKDGLVELTKVKNP